MTDTRCTHPFHLHTDAARRMSDGACIAWAVYNFDSVGKFMAFKLEDGSTNHDLYPSKADAVRHNDEFTHCFIRLHPAGMTVCEAEIMLKFHRQAYDAGFRLTDPDKANGGKELIPRITSEGILGQLRTMGR